MENRRVRKEKEENLNWFFERYFCVFKYRLVFTIYFKRYNCEFLKSIFSGFFSLSRSDLKMNLHILGGCFFKHIPPYE